jgi:phosphomannomutase/phosphoglucomutase
MFPKPKSALVPNTYAYESEPMVKATGFREYDARWLFGKEINLMGIQALGMGLGVLAIRRQSNTRWFLACWRPAARFTTSVFA